MAIHSVSGSEMRRESVTAKPRRRLPIWLRRRKLWVDPRVQSALLKELVVTLVVGAVLGVAFGHVLSELDVIAVHGGDWTERLAAWAYIAAMGITSAGIVFVVGVFHSHRVAGPAIKVSRHVGAIARGDLRELIQLRERDHLERVANAVNGIVKRLREDVHESRAIAAVLAERSRTEPDPELEALAARLSRLAGRWTLPGDPPA
jgi:methyl-accepting chemotaxis protein